MADSTPKPPRGTSAAGAKFWRETLEAYDLEPHEYLLLTQVVGTIDAIEALAEVARVEGAVVDSPQGTKASPALVELRQQRVTLGRLLAMLRLPSTDAEAEELTRPQRRAGARGVYRIVK